MRRNEDVMLVLRQTDPNVTFTGNTVEMLKSNQGFQLTVRPLLASINY